MTARNEHIAKYFTFRVARKRRFVTPFEKLETIICGTQEEKEKN